MVHINLLPWRAELRKRKLRDFVARIFLSIVLTVLVMLTLHLRVDQITEHQLRRNEFLESELRLLDQKIGEIRDLDVKKRHLIARMEVIQELQVSRPEMVHLFEDIARTVPDGVSLTDLTQTARKLVVNGVAQSNARVSGYLQNLELSPWLGEPVLNVVQAKGDKEPRAATGQQFMLQVEQSSNNTLGLRP
jgi:type IV pilus assembly protein PilN